MPCAVYGPIFPPAALQQLEIPPVFFRSCALRAKKPAAYAVEDF